MAFCTQCGRMLAEGEVCTCQQNRNQANFAYQAEVNQFAGQPAGNMQGMAQGNGYAGQEAGKAQGNGFTGQQANEMVANSKMYLAKLMEAFFGILKNLLRAAMH